MRGGIHHLDLTVQEPQASFALYDAVLRFLGYELVKQSEAAIEWTLASGKGAPSLSLVKARGDGIARQHDRYAPGLHHLAWAADSREDVDRLHALLVGIKAHVLDAPADYPQYNRGRGYYAVFFADADGLSSNTPSPHRLREPQGRGVSGSARTLATACDVTSAGAPAQAVRR